MIIDILDTSKTTQLTNYVSNNGKTNDLFTNKTLF